jgi:site-specific DNA-cytosine methylase
MPFDTEQRTYYRDLREMWTPELIPCIFERSHGYNKAKYRYNYSPTLRAKFDGNTWVYDKIGLRRFTVRELCRLQGFPIDWFSSEIPKTIIFKLIGNSFNGVMSKMVFNSIKDII